MRTLYHGSRDRITAPKFGFGKRHNDYGLGFYTIIVLSGSIRRATSELPKAVATAVRKPIPIDKTKRCKAIVWMKRNTSCR